MPLNCTLKLVKMSNFMLHMHHHNKNIYKGGSDRYREQTSGYQWEAGSGGGTGQ